MKNRLSAILDVALGALLALGINFLFPVCPVTEKVMRCFYTAEAITVVGGLLVIIGIIKLVTEKELHVSTCLISAFTLAAIALFPAYAIGGCKMPTMACRATAYPIVYIITGIGIVIQLILAFVAAKKKA